MPDNNITIAEYKQLVEVIPAEGNFSIEGDPEHAIPEYLDLAARLIRQMEHLRSKANIIAHNSRREGIFLFFARTIVDQSAVARETNLWDELLDLHYQCMFASLENWKNFEQSIREKFEQSIRGGYDNINLRQINALLQKYAADIGKITETLQNMQNTGVTVLTDFRCSYMAEKVAKLATDYQNWHKMVVFWRHPPSDAGEILQLELPDTYIPFPETMVNLIRRMLQEHTQQQRIAARAVFEDLAARADEIKVETARAAQETQRRESEMEATNQPYCAESYDLYDPSRELQPDTDNNPDTDPDSEGQIVTIIFNNQQPNKRSCFWTKQLEAAGEAQTKVYIWKTLPQSNYSPPPPNQLGPQIFKLPSGEFIVADSWEKLIHPTNTRVFQLERLPGPLRIGALQHTMSAVWNTTDTPVYRLIPVLPRRSRSGVSVSPGTTTTTKRRRRN